MKNSIKKMIPFVFICLIIFSSCGQLALLRIKPHNDFDPKKVPQIPVYDNLKNWASHPLKKDEGDITPKDYKDNQKYAKADVFFIHPTVYMGQKNWNASITPGSGTHELVRYVAASQASAFNSACRVYMPHYRQATLYSFFDKKENGTKALDIAYSDIIRAFDYYMKHFNKGRPFIIAGHSQGACHGQRLIRDRIDNTPYMKRFIAGYIIGYPVAMKRFETSYKKIKACSTATDNGCIISWMTYGKGAVDNGSTLNHYKDGWRYDKRNESLCINPVSWTTTSSPSLLKNHRGAAFAPYGSFLKTALSNKALGVKFKELNTYKKKVSAQRSGGLLYISDPGNKIKPIGRDNYHLVDISLFYLDLRYNVKERVTEYLK